MANYLVTLVTGDIDAAGTNAHVYIKLNGKVGGNATSTTEVELDEEDINNFERASIEAFPVTLEDLDQIESVTLRHDDSGDGPGWFVNAVFVKNQDTGAIWGFPCNNWLSRRDGDRQIQRNLPLDTKLDAAPPEVEYFYYEKVGDDQVRLLWQLRNCEAFSSPVIKIEDEDGVTYDQLASTGELTLPYDGAITYTLIATNKGTHLVGVGATMYAIDIGKGGGGVLGAVGGFFKAVGKKVVRAVGGVFHVAFTILEKIIDILSIPLDGFAAFLRLIFTIPYFGGVLEMLWTGFSEWLFYRPLGFLGMVLDAAMSWAGVELEKKIRICVLALVRQGEQLTPEASAKIEEYLSKAEEILKHGANIKIKRNADVHVVIAPEKNLTIDVDGDLVTSNDAFGPKTSEYRWFSFQNCVEGSFRRLINHGGTVPVFVIEQVRNLDDKRTWGVVSYNLGMVFMETNSQTKDGMIDPTATIPAALLAHELGHVCGLLHVNPEDNLMADEVSGERLRAWQKRWMRASPFVTFF